MKKITLATLLLTTLAVFLTACRKDAVTASPTAKIENCSEPIDPLELVKKAEEVEPSLDEACPYEISKCVATLEFSSNLEGWETTWDVYLYVYDSMIGTWIINSYGNPISVYGEPYAYSLDNYNVHMGEADTVCVYPDGEKGETFLVVIP